MSYNIALIGAASVGKTTIANRLVNKMFSEKYKPTIGAAMVKIPYVENDIEKYLFIWDTAGMEKYKSLTPAYFKDCTCAILVFDCSAPNSLEKASDWLDFFYETVDTHYPVLIIGNKTDLPRQISIEAAHRFAQERNSRLLEVSAKTGEGIEKIVPALIEVLASFQFPDDCASIASPNSEDHFQETRKCCEMKQNIRIC